MADATQKSPEQMQTGPNLQSSSLPVLIYDYEYNEWAKHVHLQCPHQHAQPTDT